MAKKIKSFCKEFIATVEGDSAAALAEKVFRQADSALKVQIANLNGDVIKLEDDVAAAKEGVSKARINNGREITDRTAYVEGLLTAKNNLTRAEDALKKHKEKLAFLEGEYKDLSSEVDSE